ncbi:hypothetical protein TNCV_215151 [Trichonephila clavipes]|nr:hypothetical protein TNCV_215151 [Trichonephila clavipes]
MLPVLGKKDVLEWCMKEGLIGSSYVCPKCGKSIELRERTGKKMNHGFGMVLQNSVQCERGYPSHVFQSVKKWFWFELSNMDLCTVLLVMQK